MTQAPQQTATIAVDDLYLRIRSRADSTDILRGVTFEAHPSRALGIVGETGSGKTMTMRSIFGILPAGSELSGSVRYRDIKLEPGARDRSSLLGRQFSMVFQDARSSLHPTFSIGRQLGWSLARAGVKGRRERNAQARELLARVGLRGTDEELHAYPFQFSGGMCQRVALAIALACNPDLLVADEPTSALDPTIQLQIADLFAGVVRERALTLILITHDIRLVRYLCDDVVVMLEGRVVEAGHARRVLANPTHEYTRLLLAASG